MNLNEILYMIEHQLLPKWFYEGREFFINDLLDNEDMIFETLNSILEEEELENPYSREDFIVKGEIINDDILMMEVKFPEPKVGPLAYCCYMFFDNDYEKLDFYCIEKPCENSGEKPFLCSWTPEEQHINYGECSLKGFQTKQLCKKIFMQKFGFKDKHLNLSKNKSKSKNKKPIEELVRTTFH